MLLNAADDIEEIAGVGIPVWPEHTHEALGRLVGKGAKLLETNGCVDVVPKYDLARVDVSGKQAIDAFLQQSLSKGWVASGSCLHRFFEVTGERHVSYLGVEVFFHIVNRDMVTLLLL